MAEHLPNQEFPPHKLKISKETFEQCLDLQFEQLQQSHPDIAKALLDNEGLGLDAKNRWNEREDAPKSRKIFLERVARYEGMENEVPKQEDILKPDEREESFEIDLDSPESNVNLEEEESSEVDEHFLRIKKRIEDKIDKNLTLLGKMGVRELSDEDKEDVDSLIVYIKAKGLKLLAPKADVPQIETDIDQLTVEVNELATRVLGPGPKKQNTPEVKKPKIKKKKVVEEELDEVIPVKEAEPDLDEVEEVLDEMEEVEKVEEEVKKKFNWLGRATEWASGNLKVKENSELLAETLEKQAGLFAKGATPLAKGTGIFAAKSTGWSLMGVATLFWTLGWDAMDIPFDLVENPKDFMVRNPFRHLFRAGYHHHHHKDK